MTYTDADRLIQEYLAANWTTTQIAWPNVEPRSFVPIGQPLLPMGTSDYIALRSHGTGSQTITVNRKCVRYTGQLFVAVCVKEGTGVRTAKGHTDTLVNLLENKTITEHGTGDVRMNTITGPTEYPAPNGWFVIEFAIMYAFERFVN
ncbi:MAG: DUF4128 domain-containing protein [Chromatiaceae bacterium]|nr:DUF4128 domain-containing protein [Candidatus Thioaporhodococcus sediminis]